MNIESVHKICENYFDLSSPEVRNLPGKILLSGLKALSMLTGIVPLAFAIGYSLSNRVKHTKESIGADHQNMKNVTGSHFTGSIALNETDRETDREIETIKRLHPDLKTVHSLETQVSRACNIFFDHLPDGVIGISPNRESYQPLPTVELFHQDPRTKHWVLVKPFDASRMNYWSDEVLHYRLDKCETYFCTVKKKGLLALAFNICAI